MRGGYYYRVPVLSYFRSAATVKYVSIRTRAFNAPGTWFMSREVSEWSERRAIRAPPPSPHSLCAAWKGTAAAAAAAQGVLHTIIGDDVSWSFFFIMMRGAGAI